MKKVYEKPTLARQGTLQNVTAGKPVVTRVYD